jgi:uncharacterized protein YaiL (DUF2058 family)
MQAEAFEVPVKFPLTLRGAPTEHKSMPTTPKTIKTIATTAVARTYGMANATMELRLRQLGLEPVFSSEQGERTHHLWDREAVHERVTWYQSLSHSEKLAFNREHKIDERNKVEAEVENLSAEVRALSSDLRLIKSTLARVIEKIEKIEEEPKSKPEE